MRKSTFLGVLFCAVVALSISTQAQAELIAHWNFSGTVYADGSTNRFADPISSDSGSGTLTDDFVLDPAAFTGTTVNAVGTDGASNAYCPQGGSTVALENNGKSLILAVSTATHQNIILTYATRGTSGGFTTHTVDVDTGSGFANFTSFTGINSLSAFETKTVDLTSLTAANNNANFKIRITFTGATGSTGNNRIDNIQINGDLITSDDPQATFTTLGNFGTIRASETKDLAITVLNSASSTQNLTITGLSFATGTNFSAVTTFPVSGIAPGASTTVTVRYSPGSADNASHSDTVTLVSNDPNDPSLALSGSTYKNVANIAAAKAETAGTKVNITGTVTATVATNGLNASAARYQFFIQDATGGLYIDDQPYNIGAPVAIGNQLSNMAGTITLFSNMFEFQAGAAPTFLGAGTPPAPLVVSGTDDFETFEGKLIRVNGVSIAETGTWAAETNYTLLTAVGSLAVIRIEDGSGLVGQPIPASPFDIIGIAFQSGTSYQIQPRIPADIPSAAVADWTMF